MAAFMAIGEHERNLSGHFLQRLRESPQLNLWGIDELDRLRERVPTFSLTHPNMTPTEIAKKLAKRGIYCWPGNHYALPFTEAAGLEPEGTLRIGLLHYNTIQEVDRLCDSLTEILPKL
jgi:selenocysteine lyase/cysteine desulfurase